MLKFKHQSKQRSVLVSSDEKVHPPLVCQNHHKKLKLLLPKHLPNQPRSFCDYLCRVLTNPKKENPRPIDIHSHSGDALSNAHALCQLFIVAAFPTVTVVQVASCEIEHTFPGAVFPHVTHHGKRDYHCKECSLFKRWAMTKSVEHYTFKSKQVTIDDIK